MASKGSKAFHGCSRRLQCVSRSFQGFQRVSANCVGIRDVAGEFRISIVGTGLATATRGKWITASDEGFRGVLEGFTGIQRCPWSFLGVTRALQENYSVMLAVILLQRPCTIEFQGRSRGF